MSTNEEYGLSVCVVSSTEYGVRDLATEAVTQTCYCWSLLADWE